MFLIKKIYKFLKNFLKNFGYELNVQNIKKKKHYKFLNIYKSYQEAHSLSKNKDYYVTKEYQKKAQLADLNDLEVYYRWNIVPLFCALVLKKENENDLFLEVGGGENPIFLYILKSLNKKLKFQVLEEQNFKINIPQEYKNYLNYVYKLEDIKFNNLKAVSFTSSIQYMDNYKIILEKIFNSNIEYVFILETFFTNKSDHIVVLQANMQNVRFPNIFFSFKQLNELFNKNNYELIFQTKRKVGKYTHNILGKDEFFVKDLIYKLKK
jgi:putative methyltransferase (TIGR04325 family)